MFTFKFVGLDKADAPTPYYYGSLPVKPELGHVLRYDQTDNRYAVVRMKGKGLEGDGPTNQQKLAWADIGGRKKVPTLFLQRLLPEIVPSGRSFTAEEMKESSQQNRARRMKATT